MLTANGNRHQERSQQREGVAASELALVLPFLMVLFLIAVDFTRAFYYSLALADCARAGAIYSCDPISMSQSPYQNVSQAALASVSGWQPAPTVTSSNGVDSSGRSVVTVTVSWTFTPLIAYPGIPNPVPINRSVQMQIMPTTPN